MRRILKFLGFKVTYLTYDLKYIPDGYSLKDLLTKMDKEGILLIDTKNKENVTEPFRVIKV